MGTQKKFKIPKVKAAQEKRTATAYAYIKPSNKRWLQAQAKLLGTKMSQTLDDLLDQLRENNP